MGAMPASPLPGTHAPPQVSYPAELAGLGYSVQSTVPGILVTGYGYSHTLPRLVQARAAVCRRAQRCVAGRRLLFWPASVCRLCSARYRREGHTRVGPEKGHTASATFSVNPKP